MLASHSIALLGQWLECGRRPSHRTVCEACSVGVELILHAMMVLKMIETLDHADSNITTLDTRTYAPSSHRVCCRPSTATRDVIL